ncbi:MAG: hypothetical protein ACR2QH_12505 [Geminicoccaceae bacterium]
MTAGQARMVEFGIIGLCVMALLLIFQPFALPLYSIGAGLVVLGGLAFNLIPFCREGVPGRKLVKVALIVLAILAVAFALGIGTGYLYVWYLEFQRG